MVKVIRSYPERCTGCRTCELICSLEHEGVINPEASRISVYKPNLATDVPIVCVHCANLKSPSPCMEACPEGALVFDSEKGLIKVDSELCTGCGLCVDSCPYGMKGYFTMTGSRIYSEKARVCDLCGGEPKCVLFCSSDAIKYEEIGEEDYRKIRSFFEGQKGVE
jgi:Fe-S-cluster-containing hydrogenase component 2